MSGHVILPVRHEYLCRFYFSSTACKPLAIAHPRIIDCLRFA
jgi:hypothetical protein